MIVHAIQALHLALVVGVVVSPFIPVLLYKQYALAFLLFLVLQFFLNHGECGLTTIEAVVLGEKRVDGFLYRLINPIVRFNHTEFYHYIRLYHATYILILIGQIQSFALFHDIE